MVRLDTTHDAERRSWVASAEGHSDFPIQNLPFGVFSPAAGDEPRIGVAIGDEILDLREAGRTGLLSGDASGASDFVADATLNRLMAAGAAVRRGLRTRLFAMLVEDSGERAAVARVLHRAASSTMHLPAVVGDYTDFYAGIHHAVNVGRLFRPDNPLLPNYKYVPIGYHGRSSSVCVSGAPVRRPSGQCKAPDAAAPTFCASRRLDFELELGVWIGPGNRLGETVPIARAADHVAGFCLLNDWSARDIQAWEYQPLGPFLAKNFLTSVSAWIVTPEALAPFRVAQPPRPAGDPEVMPYLLDEEDQQSGGFDIELEVLMRTAQSAKAGRPAHRLALSNARHMYWTVAQLVAHHSSNGCNLRPGDLLGTGTLSGPTADSLGSLLEITQGGTSPVDLGAGESRTFLADGDEICLRARARRDGYAPIGFGEVRGTVQAAAALPARA